MRRLLSLLLVLCLSAEFLPACTDAEAAGTDYLSGAAARRSRAGSEYANPTDNYWDFEPDDADDDYLNQGNVDAMEADSFTVVTVVTYEEIGTLYYGAMYDADNQKSWLARINAGPAVAGYTAENSCSAVGDNFVNAVGWNADVMALVAMTFDYSGNPGAQDSTRTQYIIRAGSTLSGVANTTKGPVIDCTGDLTIGTLTDFEEFAWDGRIYWWAYYASVLTEANLEDLFDGTKHPATDFTPIMYVDFSRVVAGTYAPEVGAAYVFTVNGSPVQGP